jgi:hypothetical protein
MKLKMGGACDMDWREQKCKQSFGGKTSKEGHHLGNLDVMRMILKCFSDQGERVWIGFTWLKMGTRGCNKHSGVQKVGCASYLSDCQLVKMICAVGRK